MDKAQSLVFFYIRKGLDRLEEIEKFFKLPKSIIKHDILHTKNSLSLRLFLMILGQACYRDGVQVTDSAIVLMRGQWLRSNRKLQKDLGASPTTLTAAIRWLEEKNLLRTETTQLGTIFTVLNFNAYQGNQEKECYSMSNGCYPTSNGGRYPTSNNTKNYKQTKNYKEKEDSVNNLYSVKGAAHNERDTSNIEWEQYPHLRF
jgi:DNA-binding Lrp family transcriptional regulator